MSPIPLLPPLLLLLLLAAGSARASISEDTQSSELRPVGSVRYRGAVLRKFRDFNGAEILEPFVSFRMGGKQNIRKNVFSKGYYFTLPLSVDSSLRRGRRSKIRSNSTKIVELQSFQVSLRKGISSSWCRKGCRDVSASGFRSASGTFKVLFRCRLRFICRRVFESLYFNSADSELVRSAFAFSFSGVAGRSRFRLKKMGLPVTGAVRMPLRNANWFEGNKVLLFSIKAGCGKPAYDSFVKDLGYRMPADGSMPDVYRSPLIDNLQAAVRSSSRWQMVAEMRTGGNTVAQVVFNVRRKRSSLTATNWFSAARVESSYPFHIAQSGYNFFSVAGDARHHRRFFINNFYGGCAKDTGLWSVNDNKDPCPWSNQGWKGRAPVLAYNTAAGRPYQSGGVRQADQFLIYLRYSVPSLTPTVVNPFRNDFEFEKGKLLLFTVRAHSNINAYNAFAKPKVYKIPTDRSLPTVYRSGFLENLPASLSSMGKRRIVAEMRKGGKAVARIVFQPTGRSYNKFTWFSKANLVSSFPIKLTKSTKFNFFSVPGHVTGHVQRRFFVNFYYGGCAVDRGFWVVSDIGTGCPWEKAAWKGSGPALIYSKSSSQSYQQGGAKYADRFLIYLQ